MRQTRRGRQRGFTLIELVVSLAVTVLIILGVLELFDINSKISRVQTNVADLQQSIRIAQYDLVRMTRMAGRGGLPLGTLPDSLALEVRNDVSAAADDHWIAFANNGSPPVVAGSDVLTLRGVLNTPLYHFNPQGGAMVLGPAGGIPPGQGDLTLRNPNPWTGIEQSLVPVRNVITNGVSEALLIVSPLGTWAVVEILPGASTIVDPNNVIVRFRWTGSATADAYATLSQGGTFQPTLQTVAAAGLLEEYRFYIREEHEVSTDPSTELMPRLSRARFLPGSETAHPSNPNLADDVADNIFDLQVALGIDTDNDEEIDEGAAEDDAARGLDDWLFNATADPPPGDAKWTVGNRPLYYLRITTLARTDRRDTVYRAPDVERVEDRDYRVAPYNTAPYYLPNTETEWMFRRRLLTTIVDLRSL